MIKIFERTPDSSLKYGEWLQLTNLDIDTIIAGRNLEEFIQQMIAAQEKMVLSEGIVYSMSDYKSISIEIDGDRIIRYLEKEGLSSGDLVSLFSLIRSDIISVSNIRMVEDIVDSTFIMTPPANQVWYFEQLELGILLWLSKLQEKYPEVCFMRSSLDQAIEQSIVIERLITTRNLEEFTLRFPQLSSYYDYLSDEMNTMSTERFRYYIVDTLLEQSGPFIYVSYKDSNCKLRDSFIEEFRLCLASSARFVVSYVIAEFAPAKKHITLILIDKEERTIERFDSTGNMSELVRDRRLMQHPWQTEEEHLYQVQYAQNERRTRECADFLLNQLAESHGMTYIPPTDLCPLYGPQIIESKFKLKGFCLTWSIMYLERRLRTNLPRDYLAQNLDKIIMQELETNDYQQLELYILNQIDTQFKSMDSYYKQLSKYFKAKVGYTDRALIIG